LIRRGKLPEVVVVRRAHSERASESSASAIPVSGQSRAGSQPAYGCHRIATDVRFHALGGITVTDNGDELGIGGLAAAGADLSVANGEGAFRERPQRLDVVLEERAANDALAAPSVR
jgi:hypothetical protein